MEKKARPGNGRAPYERKTLTRQRQLLCHFFNRSDNQSIAGKAVFFEAIFCAKTDKKCSKMDNCLTFGVVETEYGLMVEGFNYPVSAYKIVKYYPVNGLQKIINNANQGLDFDYFAEKSFKTW